MGFFLPPPELMYRDCSPPSIFGFQPLHPVSCILSFPLKMQQAQTERREGGAVQLEGEAF